MTTAPAEPRWVWEVCTRGHSLRLHGAPRPDRPGSYKCRACHREWDAARRARLRESGAFDGWKGTEHACSSMPEVCTPDEAAVLRFVAGEGPRLYHWVDRAEAIARLDRQGMSAAQIARRVGCSSRTVVRVRVRIREGRPYGTSST